MLSLAGFVYWRLGGWGCDVMGNPLLGWGVTSWVNPLFTMAVVGEGMVGMGRGWLEIVEGGSGDGDGEGLNRIRFLGQAR
jgi:hypothetical protein